MVSPPLHIACKKNRVKVMELLLKHGASIQAVTESGLTPIHVAAFMGHDNIVHQLINHGASPNTSNVRGETALHMAARAGQSNVVRYLIQNGARVDAKAKDDQTPLHISSRLGKQDIVAQLLSSGAFPDATTNSGYTPLHLAAREGHRDVASTLLDQGASLGIITKKGFTPLHVAAKYGKIEVANLLLQKSAPSDAAGKSGLTPLHVAAHYDNQKVALLLLNQGASPHAAAKNGYTPLHIAAKKNQMEITTTLLEYGASTNTVTRQGITPLHLAAQEGNVDIVTLLLARDAPINMSNKSGLTPLHLAAQEDKVNVAEVLVNQGATIDPETKLGYSPLHVACHYGNVKMVNFLLKNQAKVNAKTKNGYTPLHQAAQQGHTHIINLLLQFGALPNELTTNGNSALSIARRLGYISVVDTLKVVTEETLTTKTVIEKHKMNVPETMNEVLDMSDDEVFKANVPEMITEDYISDVEEGDDAMTGDTDKYLAPQDLRELGDDSLPQEGYMGFSVGARSQSPKVSSDRSNTLNRSSFTRDSMMIEEMLAPNKEMMLCKERSFIVEKQNQHLAVAKDFDNDSLRRYSWTADALDNVNLVSSPVHSGFLVSFMVDARGGSMRGSRHNGMRIIIPPRKCTAPTRITCRLVKRHKLASPPPMVEGEGLASRLVEVGPAGAQFLGPVIVEIPHFASMRGQERELILLRSENGESWKEHMYDYKADNLNTLLSGMDEELDSAEELKRKRICRIITKDFPQYFAVVSRIRQETNHMGPEGGTLCSRSVPLVQASFPEGALTKKIKVGLQAQPVPDDNVKKILGNRATFSPIVTVEPRRRKFHKPITMTIPIPPLSGEGLTNGYKGDCTPCLRLLCSITGGTSPAQWEDITGTTPLTFVNDCVSFTTNVSARFWLADCHQIPETVGLAMQLYRDLICVPYMAKFVVFAKTNDPVESRLRCFCMTDDKVDKTLEQQENFEEVARSKDIEVLEGRPIYVDCYGNLAPLTKGGQQLVLNFYAFKENRLPFCVKVRDPSQEPCGRLTFLKECKTMNGLPQTAVCNLNITLPAVKKEMESDAEDETEKPERRHTFASLALRPQSPCERTDLRMAIVADHLGLSWTELARELEFSVDEINFIRVENPNSLTAQSFMLLKKWVHRDGKNATTDALTAMLTKINRLDIVTLLEGPIFDYGYDTIDLELRTPTELNYQPPTPLRSDDFFSEADASADSPSKVPLTRPSDLSLTQTTSTSSSDPPTVAPGPASFSAPQPPMAGAEDTTLIAGERGMPKEDETGLVYSERPDNDRRAVEQRGKGTGEHAEALEKETSAGQGVGLERQGEDAASDSGRGNGRREGEEEEEEMTAERLQSLLDDIKQEGGSGDEEMTEERMNAILQQLHHAEKDVCSVPDWRCETSGASGHSAGTEEGSPDSLADSLEADGHNGGHVHAASEEKEAERTRPQEGSGTAGPSGGRQEAGERCQHKVQDSYTNAAGCLRQESVRAPESSSDEETTVTTRVYRRRVILKGQEAKNIPGESVTEEQFTDEDGDLVTRKVIRKVVRRVFNTEERRGNEGETVKDGSAAGGGGAGVGGAAGAGASSAGAPGEKGKKRGKRSRQGNKAEKPGANGNKKQGKKSQS